MFFEDFEGYKKIKNTMQLTINGIFELLKKYEKEIGSITMEEELPNVVLIKVQNKYIVDLRLEEENIIIERKFQKDEINNDQDSIEKGKDLAIVQSDRMIEQIYDLLNDYIKNNGTISEHITSVKKILYMEEENRLLFKGVISLGNLFKIKDENGTELYEAKQNHINKLYAIKNLKTGREEYSLRYEKSDENKFSILKQAYDKTDFFQDPNSVKTIFKANVLKKEFKITADYTDNHYLIELNEIVIGAIDCLDPLVKNKYKLEINDLEQEALIVTIAIMLDIYNLKNNNELGVQ